jgi:uncharacterized protein YfbU (UPF0304 family)
VGRGYNQSAMRNINLTKTERLILANQNRILAALYPDQAEGYKHRAEVLENGYTWFYGNVFQEIYDGLTPEECEYVTDVMVMYWRLQESNDELKTGRLDPKKLSFPGFDGNNETAFMGFARYLMQDRRFTTLRVASTDFNSHRATRDRYEKMLAEWRRMGGTKRPPDLSAEEIHRVID